jgi:beta-glucanase (GH16 family)
MISPLTGRRAVMLGAPALCLIAPKPTRAEPVIFREDFSDFSASSQAMGRWRTQLGGGGPRSLTSRAQVQSGDQQVYVDKEMLGATGISPLGLDPFSVGPEGLEINALRTPEGLLPRLWNQPFTSGVINTRFSFAFKYGRLRIVAAMPPVMGTRSIFWLLPRVARSNGYITVAGINGSAPGICHLGIGSADRVAAQSAQKAIALRGPSDAMRSYGLDWGPERLTWLINDVEVASIPTPFDMHNPMILMIALPVGDRWAGLPAPGDFAARLRVKEVLVTTAPDGPGFLTQLEQPLRLADQRSPQ